MNETQTPVKRVKRHYRKITPSVVARFKTEQALQGNGTAAVEVLEPDYMAPYARAHRIVKHGQEVSSDDYIEQRLEQIAVKAIDKVDSMVNSTDERIATKNAHFIIEQRRGKAVQKTENKNFNLNIQSVLE